MQPRKVQRKRPSGKAHSASGRSRLPGQRKRELAALVSEPQREGGPDEERAKAEAPQEPAPAAVAPAARPRSCLFIDESVRSGQTVEFPDGDVTVIGSVGSGAEIIAGGSIHVYGALRGRAFAGAAGDAGARIFCNSLDAELLAINGLYRVADSLDASLRGRPVQAWLEGKAIAMAPLE